MDDNQLDLCLKAYFKEKIPLENSLVLKTKLRLKRKAEAKDNLMLCLIQIGFWIMTFALGFLAFITVGFNAVIFVFLIAYITIIGIIGGLLTLLSSRNTNTKRRIGIYE